MRYPLSLVFLVIPFATTLVAQERIDLDGFRKCSECRLTPLLDLRLGIDRPDLIEDRGARAVFDTNKREYVVMAGPATLAFFDSSGRYVRHVGRRGRGPGEFQFIRDVGFSNGQMVVLDVGQGRWTVLGEDGMAVHHRVPIGGASGFMIVVPDTVVVVGMGTTPETVGFPLHLVTLSTGKALAHFGSETGDFNVARPWALRVLFSPGLEPRTVWIATPSRLRFEEWSLQGRLLRIVDGTPDWFPPVDRIPPFGQEPPTRMRQFAVDSVGRLWVASWIPSATWRHAVSTAQRTPDGETFIDTAEYFATRVDVYNLRDRTYYGSFQWDDDEVGLFDRNGEILIQIVEWDNDKSVPLSLYNLEPRAPGRRPEL